MSNVLKRKLIDRLIAIEGGYSNNSNDSGGETKYGITKQVAEAQGYFGNMKDLSYEIASGIYSDKYWIPLKLDEISRLSPKIAEELFDIGVNQGVSKASLFLQRSLNSLNNCETLYYDISADGIIGKGTLSSLSSFLAKRGTEGEAVLLKALNCLQGEFYISLAEKRKKDEEFLFGWLKNRVAIAN